MKTKGRFDEDEPMTSTTTPFVIENTRPQSTIDHPLSLSISDSQILVLPSDAQGLCAFAHGLPSLGIILCVVAPLLSSFARLHWLLKGSRFGTS
ncbi:hypothetical protein E3N88_29689 [Mikania micrantha]|uniref:Uncharacterized protein n=1 Tax=Mikania micrantha TaxID=192012 RepID=A0A5N6MK61_9ASTR|nr:hypothetical protein E3N88_29689 [Mikania micrantha]